MLPRRPTEGDVKYALLIYSAPGARNGPLQQSDEVIDSWIDYTAALREAGAVLGAQQLQPTETATTVELSGGERLLTDGPFIETKEHLLGFYLIDVAGLDEALDWAARMPVIRYGKVEVRPVVDGAEWQKQLQ
jgi:hypothetical protein